MAAPLSFFDHFERWIAKEKQKASVRTGCKLSDSTIWAHGAVRTALRAFSEASGVEVSFAGLNQAFYNGLRNYMLGETERSSRTFNTYIKRLRSFSVLSRKPGLVRAAPPAFARCCAWRPAMWARTPLPRTSCCAWRRWTSPHPWCRAT